MKQMIDGVIREMTQEEETEFYQMIANTDPPIEDKSEAFDILMGVSE